MEVKICGITNSVDAQAAVDCGADALGFIFHAPSPRYVSPEEAKGIIDSLSGNPVCKVGVFVNQKALLVKEITSYCGFDLVQLHGDESPEYCRSFPALKLIKAVSPRGAEDLKSLDEYAVRSFLIDSRCRGLYGGTGKTCDWGLAAMIARVKPLILSGGLGPENLEEAIRNVSPLAVDICSGVESAPGIKDHGKMRMAVEKVRAIHDSPQGSRVIYKRNF